MATQHPSTDPQSATDTRSADRDRHRQVLNELIDLGADIARLMHGQISLQAGQAEATTSTPRPGELPAAVAAFDRVVRCVRRTVLLVERLAEPVLARCVDSAGRQVAARKRIIRAVEDAIERRADGDEADELLAEARERLDAADLTNDIETQPVDDIIADICRDLGIGGHPGSQIWKRRTPGDIKDLCARAMGVRVVETPDWPRHRPTSDQAERPEQFARLAAVPITR